MRQCVRYLRLGENFRAFDYLGNSLTHDPKNPKTILAAGSIIQDHSDMDVALVKPASTLRNFSKMHQYFMEF